MNESGDETAPSNSSKLITPAPDSWASRRFQTGQALRKWAAPSKTAQKKDKNVSWPDTCLLHGNEKVEAVPKKVWKDRNMV